MRATLLALLLAAASAFAPRPSLTPTTSGPRASADEIRANDNRVAAGRLSNGVLTIRLEAREGVWFPETKDGPGIDVYAFAEEGRALQIPGPLVRVPAGTEIRATVRNALPKAMRLRGLQDHQTALLDTFDIAPGATREIRFRADAPGTYYYWGRTEGNLDSLSTSTDSQLLGAFVVDPAGTAPPAGERVMVLTLWVDPNQPEGRGPEEGVRQALVVNGLSWPYTERLRYAVGDTVRWRVINGTVRLHPMHLHGFYFTVAARGDALRDTVYTPPQRRVGVTEFMPRGTTMAATWTPTRPGNWLFHCHLIAHINARLRLRPRADEPGHAMDHARDGMAGLVIGVQVSPARGVRFAADPTPRRTLRLFVNERPAVYGTSAGYSFVLQEGTAEPAVDSVRRPSSTIVLRRGEPAEITIVNRARSPVSIHWHGIELESYYDGAGGWSGWGARLAPPVAPGDSFVVRMTPDRAGTFIYHTHTDELVQLVSGLYGPLIVVAEGSAPDTTERLFLMGAGGPGLATPPFLNGSASPPPVELTAGTAHRFRFINIAGVDTKRVRLLSDTALRTWRALAKDGADLPPRQASVRPAQVVIGPGETYDFEVRRDAPEALTLEIVTTRRRGDPPMTMRVPVWVRPR